jgi:Zn-dependent peptidase ImmA (M78 family)
MRHQQHNQASAAAREQSVLAKLRALVPNRPLTPSETLRIAELQANHLLRHFQIETAAVPEEIVSELPRLRVVREGALPVSGVAHWNGRYWVITLSADEHPFRQRFSLMHEFKHVLDHTTKQFLYRDRSYQTAGEQAERVADYFAACTLMPKRVVKRLWCQGNQNILRLAETLQVSPAAIRYRLDQLGLTERPSRCNWLPARRLSVSRSSTRRYTRLAPGLIGERL